MDYHKLVQLISSKQELWDRCDPVFREPRLKEKVWKEVAAQMGQSVASCKDGYKHIREKYIRERGKRRLLGDKYQPWDLLPHLKFLDNQIIPRKGGYHSMQFHHNNIAGPNRNSERNELSSYCELENMQNSLDMLKGTINNRNDYQSLESAMMEESETRDFYCNLVNLVKQSKQLWDWENRSFWNKQVRYETWNEIGKKLHKTSAECLLKWKGLREKYIREKAKNKENSKHKWELLDSMSFLDTVIQYRKCPKIDDHNVKTDIFPHKVNQLTTEDFFSSGESSSSNADYHYQVIGEENSLQEPPTEFLMEVKEEAVDIQDSSYDSEGSSKKRRLSINSNYSLKKSKKDKTPEELFGELVASLLTKKSESDRHTAMVEIMKVLAK